MNFKKIRSHCKQSSSISESLVDDFLINYCAEHERLNPIMARRLREFREVIQKMPERWPFMIASQYIAHRLFREGGFAQTYLERGLLNDRSEDELSWLAFQTEHPWRFSFFTIKEQPDRDFFVMTDELIGEEILLHSPGIANILDQHGPIQMLLLLVGFNGECWQTYGNLAYFRSMQPFDLLYFARQLGHSADFLNSIPEILAKDPIPFMLLWRGGEIPLAVHGKDLVVFNKSEFHDADFVPEKYAEQFVITKKHPVYRLQLKRWSSHPHFSVCFYHAKRKRLVFTAMTDRGYTKIIEAFETAGNKVPHTPEIRATMAMIFTAKEIFKTEPELVPYEKTFAEPVSPEHQKELDKINSFIRSFLPYHNKKKSFDLHALAEAAGIDDDLAKQVIEHIRKTTDRMGR
ncbi:MAG: hypothetical protein GF401_19605 [Chitinivibrionales bacterium]|nr:hypothetical protein [Chitinivibrionales bacterium]